MTVELTRRVRHAVYAHFIEHGIGPELEDLARRAETTAAEAASGLEALAKSHDLVLRPGTHEVWMAHPFSGVETGHRVQTPEMAYWANCAWDALGIPAMLGVDADTFVPCPQSGEHLTLSVRDGELQPEDAVVHFLVPPRDFWKDIGFT